ncbi:recombinase family protein [Solwaraspora sp. WMMD1047]|uniref:recombinase family protein n=1 Tax=Solwaraspora sp. WMMD1047 TaxID=3016102 RepID=UPI00241645E4|nr:recombinase family protein [Solwaraspora sp. WMMD1047]MDG4834789.1 recombinase family protein [Solwaraspora sp. WMMD1047]
MGERVPVAGLIRVSTDDLQDPVGSAIRQMNNNLAALPAGWEIDLWFIDIESGRMEFDERGTGTAHLRFDLPVERAGGLADLLEEAKRPNCRFAAVICENAERMARYVYFNTRIEYELARHGIELFASDEPIDLHGKKAAKVLLRRIKQAVGEWTAINTFEQAWDGLKTHTTSGYNIGRAPYGYRTQPHKEGERVKSKLVVDKARGPVVTQIFRWRVDDEYTYGQIAARLNANLDRYPPPEPLRKDTAVGCWTWESVRNLLHNPKYTGHMVWNRTTTRTGVTLRRKRTHRPNPIDQWVWSPTETHTALVSLSDFRAAATVADRQRGHRPGHEANTHPATKNTYLLRGYLRHEQCQRRMPGTLRGDRTYYYCRGPRNTRGEKLMADHPGTIYIREDILLPAITGVIAERVFGPHRRQHLAAQHAAAPRHLAEAHAEAIAATTRTLDDITTRQDSIGAELEETPVDNKAWRTNLRDRFNNLETRRIETEARLAELTATQPVINTDDVALLDAMPQVEASLASLPEQLQRQLFDILNLEVRLPNAQQAHIKITLTADTPRSIFDGSISAVEPLRRQTTEPSGKAAKSDITDIVKRDDAGLAAPATMQRLNVGVPRCDRSVRAGGAMLVAQSAVTNPRSSTAQSATITKLRPGTRDQLMQSRAFGFGTGTFQLLITRNRARLGAVAQAV